MIGNCPQCGRTREPNYRFCPQCGFPIDQIDVASSDPFIGAVLGGAYVLLEKIGSGGMGAVYRAEQRALGRTVAVKLIHGHLLQDANVSVRFFNEAHAASRLSHPNVVSVIDFGKTDSGVPYLVMEHLRGHDLRTVMREVGLMEVGRIEGILLQILDALAEAHALGVVHRDLKPANVVLEPTRSGGDFIKVVDFGLAKILHGSSERALATGGLVRGTPTYMAPEQAKGGSIDLRTDIYALGVTLFELLTGRPPFESNSVPDLMLKHLHTPAPDPRAFAPTRSISEALAEITLRALAKDPDDRFQTADDFARALRASQTSTSDACAYPTIPVPGRAAACPTCGEPLTSSQKFCGSCGLPVSTGTPSDGISARSVPGSQMRLGRRSTHLKMQIEGVEDHLAWLHDLRLHHDVGAKAARIVGHHGAGKTTLLREFAASARGHGDAVAIVGPDPWWAEPAYHALRGAILQLVRLPCEGTDPLGWAGAWPEAVSGLQGIFLGVSDHAQSPEAYRRAACEALCWALERACRGSMTGRVVVVIDDLERIDGVSRNAFADALATPREASWLLVTSHSPDHCAPWHAAVPERVIQGIAVAAATAMLRAVGADGDRLNGAIWIPPLLVEQMIRAKLEGHEQAPTALVELVAHRIAALSPSARSVLDAMAVLGDDVSLEDLGCVVDETCDIDEGLMALAIGGLIDRGPNGLRWVSPVFRDVARSRTSEAARLVLCARAADLLEERGAPVEVRASLALEAGRGLEALFLLECVARTAKLRGDDAQAIRALRRGYEFARTARSEEGIEEPDHAVVVFGRKLGEALLDAGRLPEAKNMLREVLELADAQGAVDVLRGLARVARAENRSGEAQAFLQEAITQARRSGKTEILDSLEQLERKWAS